MPATAALPFMMRNARFLGFGFLGAFSSGFGQTFYFAIFLGAIRAELEMSHGDVSAVYAAGTLVSAALLAATGGWIDRWKLGNYALLTCVLMAASALVAGWAQNALMLFLAVLGLRFSGQGMMTHMAMTSMARYFTDRRGLAVGVGSAGMSFGASVYPLIGVLSMNALGWRGAFFAAAASAVFLIMPAIMVLLRGHRHRHAQYLEELKAERTATTDGAAGVPEPSKPAWKLIFFTPVMWLVLPSMISLPAIITGLTLHQVAIVTYKGWPLDAFAASYAISAVVSVVTAFGTGMLVDRWGSSRWALPLMCLFGVLQPVVLWYGEGLPTIWLFMLFNGLAMGCVSTVSGSLWPELFGREKLGAIRGWIQPIMVAGSAVGPIVFGVLLDRADGAIGPMLAASFGYYAFALVLGLIFALKRPQPQTE